MNTPDFGDPPMLDPSKEVPVFWACGVTSHMAVLEAKLPLVITHSPGCMVLLDVLNAHLENVPQPAGRLLRESNRGRGRYQPDAHITDTRRCPPRLMQTMRGMLSHSNSKCFRGCECAQSVGPPRTGSPEGESGFIRLKITLILIIAQSIINNLQCLFDADIVQYLQ